MVLATGRLCLANDLGVVGGERRAVPAPERADVCATELTLGEGVIGAATVCARPAITPPLKLTSYAADCDPPSCPMGVRL